MSCADVQNAQGAIGPGSYMQIWLRCYACVKTVTLKVLIVIRSNQDILAQSQ